MLWVVLLFIAAVLTLAMVLSISQDVLVQPPVTI